MGNKVEGKSESSIAGKNYGRVELRRDNQTLSTVVRNYSSNEVPIANCFVTEIKARTFETNVEMEISRGIKMGMSKQDLDAAVDGLDFETETSAGSDMTSYIFRLDPPNIAMTVEIITKNDVVIGIALDHTLPFSEFGE